MPEYLPFLIIGALIGVFSVLFLAGYFVLKKKSLTGYDRTMKDSQIIRRLLGYAKPYRGRFVLALFVMLFSIGYDLLSPLLVGHIEELVSGEFALNSLLRVVAVYAGILLVSVVCTYIQAMILQKTGQQILSQIRMELFENI
jgi:ATP-binding cassette subfamily B protein